MKDLSYIFFAYNSFNDPLIRNTFFKYLLRVSEKFVGRYHYITFEQQKYNFEISQDGTLESDLKNHNIIWYPLIYRTGKLLALVKFFQLVHAILLVGRIYYKERPVIIVSYANVAGSISYLLSKIYRIKLCIYSYEPHASFMLEQKVWSKNSLAFRLLNFLEWRAGLKAQYIITGTKHMVEILNRRGASGKIFRAPTGVDETDFYFRSEGREKIRKLLNIENRKVILYIGKFGDLYYQPEPIASFVKTIVEINTSYYLIVVTSSNIGSVEKAFKDVGLAQRDYYLTQNLNYEDLKDFLSAGDIGLSIVPPGPNQKYRSPTKVGEYMMSELPFITCKGVSEDDYYALEYGTGVVVDNYGTLTAKKYYEEIDNIINNSDAQFKHKIRQIGIMYHSIEQTINAFNAVFSQLRKDTE